MINLEDNVVKNSKVLQQYGNQRAIANSDEAFLEDAFADIDNDNEVSTTNKQVEGAQKDNRDDGASFMKHIAEIPPSIGSGMLKATQELGNFALDTIDWVDEAIGSGKLIDQDDRISALSNPRNVFQPETMTGKITAGISQFLLPFGSLSKAAKGIQATGKIAKFIKAGTIGFAADFAAFDPHEERFSNLIQKYPELANLLFITRAYFSS